MVIPLIESELSWSSCETQKTREECRFPVRAWRGENTNMPRGKRCFPGGSVFHALNRGNGR